MQRIEEIFMVGRFVGSSSSSKQGVSCSNLLQATWFCEHNKSRSDFASCSPLGRWDPKKKKRPSFLEFPPRWFLHVGCSTVLWLSYLDLYRCRRFNSSRAAPMIGIDISISLTAMVATEKRVKTHVSLVRCHCRLY